MTTPRAEQGDLTALPEALQPLTQEARWVCWKWQKVTNKKGESKWTKVPYRPGRPNAKASSTDSASWGSYKAALRAYQDEQADGIGYCLHGDSIGAFDLDNCRDPRTGEVCEAAQELVTRAASYTEVTVSGTGLRIIGHASGDEIHRKQQVNGFELETYRNAKRYIVVTGNPLNGAPDQLADIDELMDEVVAEIDAGKKQGKAGNKGGSKGGSDSEDKLARIIRRG